MRRNIRPATAFVLVALFVTALSFTACDSSSTGPSGGGGNKAVVVGISQYQVPSFNLSFADDDALDYFNALVQGTNWAPGEISVLLNGQATRSAIIDVYRIWKQMIRPRSMTPAMNTNQNTNGVPFSGSTP